MPSELGKKLDKLRDGFCRMAGKHLKINYNREIKITKLFALTARDTLSLESYYGYLSCKFKFTTINKHCDYPIKANQTNHKILT